MAYDEGLATRVRELLGGEAGLAEKKMFGGLAMLLDGNMAVGVRKDGLIVRTDPDQHERLLTEEGAVVDASGCAEDSDLRRWVDRGVAYARSLPPK